MRLWPPKDLGAALVVAGAVVVTLLVVAAAKGNAGEFKSGVFEPPRPAPEFDLPSSTGSMHSLRAHRGKVVALVFGFTHCARVCPTTLSKLTEVERRLGPAAKDFDVVFVTVDPERDTPERLREFLDFFDPSFVGATGDAATLRALHTAYGVTSSRQPAEDAKRGYDVHHSTSIFLIDRSGTLRLLSPFGISSDDLVQDVKRLLEA